MVGRGSGGWNGGGTVEGEDLGLVGLDGVEEGGVVDGAGGGDLAKDEIDVPRSKDDVSFGGVVGREGCVVTLNRCSAGSLDRYAGWKMQDEAGLDVQRRAQIDG